MKANKNILILLDQKGELIQSTDTGLFRPKGLKRYDMFVKISACKEEQIDISLDIHKGLINQPEWGLVTTTIKMKIVYNPHVHPTEYWKLLYPIWNKEYKNKRVRTKDNILVLNFYMYINQLTAEAKNRLKELITHEMIVTRDLPTITSLINKTLQEILFEKIRQSNVTRSIKINSLDSEDITVKTYLLG